MTLFTLYAQRFALVFFLSLSIHYIAGASMPEPMVWYQVEISEDLELHIATLNEDEKWEQCRDWVVLAFVHSLELDENTAFEYLFDFSPFRTDMLLPFSSLQYGESRYLLMKNGEAAAFVPFGSSRKRDYLARIADEYRLIHGKKPANLRVIEYEISMEDYSVRFQYAEDVKPEQLFSNEYGYVELKVAGSADLKRFLETTHDIVFAQKSGGESILLGGRIYQNYQGKPFTLEDVATLYQADRMVVDQYIERIGDRGLVNEYNSRKKQFSEILNMFTIEDIEQELSYMKFQLQTLTIYGNEQRIQEKKAEIEEIEGILEEIKSISSYENYVEFFKRQNANASELNIGFSLDPTLKHAEFASGLRRIANGDKEFALQWYNRRERSGDKESLIFQSKRLDDLLNGSDGDDSGIDMEILDLLSFKEQSLQSLLFGDDSQTPDQSLEREELVNALAGLFDIPEERLQRETDEIFEETWKITQANKQIILDIAQRLETGKTESQRMGLYFQIRRYIEDDMLIQLSEQSGKRNFAGEDSDETYVNKLIFRDIVEILSDLGYLPDNTKAAFDQEVVQAVLKFQSRSGIPTTGVVDNLTMQAMLKSHPLKEEELSRFNRFLREFYTAYSYQKARYDGDLQGTEVGMTLFYTDLAMKLWSFDYKNAAPKDFVPGFFPQTERPISIVHKLDIEKNSSTRSWLGPLQSSYDFYNNGKELNFSHCATTIYNASSSDLFPGVEREANFSSASFANWWNNHYSQVADFEPEFHRLNQIMKWSVLAHWLKIDNRFNWLNQERNIRRNLNFETWYPDNSTLKTRPAISFLNRTELKEKTECLDILNSKPFSAFLEEFLIYQFSGGVTTATKKQVLAKMETKKPQSVFIRKEANYATPLRNNELALSNGARLKIDLPGKIVNVSPKESAVFRGADGEVFGLKNLERKVSVQAQKTSLRQQSGDIFLGEVSAEASPGKILLSARESDLSNYRRYLAETAQANGSESAIFNSDKVEVALFLPADKSYIVKLEGSANYLKLAKEPVPVGPYRRSDKVPYQLRYAAGDEFYLTGSILKEREAAQIMQKYPWKKVTQGFSGSKVEITNQPPAKTGDNVVYFSHRDFTAEAIIQKDAYFLKHQSPQTDNAILSFLNDGGSTFISKLGKGQSEGYIFTKNGERIGFTRRQNMGGLKDVEGLVSTSNPNIRAIVTSEDATAIRFANNGTLEIPPASKLTPQQIEIVKFANEKTARNKEWLEVFGNREITHQDAIQLSKIADDNLALAKGYYNVKSLETMPEGMAFADFRTSGKELQIVLKSGNAEPQVLNIGKAIDAPLKENIDKINKYYHREINLTNDELLELTRPLADMQREAIRQSGGARKIVTVEFEGVNSELVNKLHQVNPEVQFFKDQPDIDRSIKNAKNETLAEFEGALFLSTASLSTGGFPEITRLHGEIIQFGIPYLDDLTAEKFIEILEDSAYQQIVLVVRTSSRGIVMSDRTLSFSELQMALEVVPEKELIFLTTNRPEDLEKIFAESGRFQKIISSRFQLGEVESFVNALENVHYFYQGFAGDVCTMSSREYKKLMKQNPGMASSLASRVRLDGKKSVVLEVGKLNREQKKSIPARMWDFLGQKMGKGASYKPRSIESIIDDRQKIMIEQMKTDSKLKRIDYIPTWKVWAGAVHTRNLC